MRAFVEALLADRVLHILDDEGRPLSEQADPVCPSSDEAICRYAGSRRGMPINALALAQVNRHWAALSGDLRRLAPAAATLQQAFQLTLAMVSAPLLWPVEQAQGSERVPGLMAAKYKVGVGFCQVFAWLLLQQDDQGQRPLASLGSGREFADWVEVEGWLLGGRQACAGSAGQIAAVFEVFCSGSGPTLPSCRVLEVVALQTALVLGTYQALRERAMPADDSLGCRLLQQGRAPWLFAVTARPNVPPEAARWLFPPHGVSVSLERFLAQQRVEMSFPEREALFWEVATSGAE